MIDEHLRPNRYRGVYHHGLLATQPSCDTCPLRFKRKVFPDGPVPARIVFIGDEPGRKEERVGRNFVGPSGELLWNHLCPPAGILREECWVTNACLCRAEKVQLSNGAILPREDVQKIAAACCYQRLIDELVVVDPVVCIPVGNIALKALTQIKKSSVHNYRGSRLEINLPALADRIRKQACDG